MALRRPSMAGVRRNGRLLKQIPIILLRTDTSRRVFSEEKHTLLPSPPGARICSPHKISPHEVLPITLPQSHPLFKKPPHLYNSPPPQFFSPPPLQHPPTPALPSLATN